MWSRAESLKVIQEAFRFLQKMMELRGRGLRDEKKKKDVYNSEID